MLRSDTRLFTKWLTPAPEPWKGPPWRVPEQPAGTAPWSPVGGAKGPDTFDPHAIGDLSAYLQGIGANHLVPAPQEDSDEGPEWTFGQAERKTEDGGTNEEWRRGIREYVSSGYTRRNPDGTHEVDNDWRGKWLDTDITIAEVSDRTEKAEVSVADGSFGDADSLFSGDGQVLGAEADAGYKGSLSSEGLEASADAQASAYVAQGQIETADDGLISAEAEGAVLKAEAEAKGEVILTAEQATLGGTLGASANLVEGKVGGEFSITPTRISRAAVSLYNWLYDEDATALSDDWDFGIVINGEVSGAVGAQAEGEAEAGYTNGRLRAEAGAKLGLGVGAGVKVGGGLTGLDKAWARIKDGWNALWD
ncbi:hypothetical protein [Paracoccus sp. Ld10]|uniref:hypothetical protein n=1 Tax=Paracoccus sp. Ld10 TaxID=649158 RepID=UPI0038690B06